MKFHTRNNSLTPICNTLYLLQMKNGFLSIMEWRFFVRNDVKLPAHLIGRKVWPIGISGDFESPRSLYFMILVFSSNWCTYTIKIYCNYPIQKRIWITVSRSLPWFWFAFVPNKLKKTHFSCFCKTSKQLQIWKIWMGKSIFENMEVYWTSDISLHQSYIMHHESIMSFVFGNFDIYPIWRI